MKVDVSNLQRIMPRVIIGWKGDVGECENKGGNTYCEDTGTSKKMGHLLNRPEYSNKKM